MEIMPIANRSTDYIIVDKYVNDFNQWDRESIAFLGLSMIPGIGFWTLYKIAQAGIGFTRFFEEMSRQMFIETLKNFGASKIRIPDSSVDTWGTVLNSMWDVGRKVLYDLRQDGVNLIFFNQPKFPTQLKEINEPAYWLFYSGSLDLLSRPSVAIVGTRNPTMDAFVFIGFLFGLLREIDHARIPTVSGLATGIDQSVHQQSNRFGHPTISVLGAGILADYPKGTFGLRQSILERGGAIISEYLPNQDFSRENFVRRNRLQSGLARVVIPVEWKSASGTAHTVRFAREQGKTVICLRWPDWRLKDHGEFTLAKKLGAKLFTIPTEAPDLVEELMSCLGYSVGNKTDKDLPPSDQLPLL